MFFATPSSVNVFATSRASSMVFEWERTRNASRESSANSFQVIPERNSHRATGFPSEVRTASPQYPFVARTTPAAFTKRRCWSAVER